MNLYVLDKETRKLFDSFFDDAFIAEDGDSIISLGMLDDDKPVGLLVAAVFAAEIDIQFLYVAKEYRRKHVASTLLEKIISVGKEVGVGAIYTSFAQGTDGCAEFLKSFKFSVAFNPGLYSYEDKLGNMKEFGVSQSSNFKVQSFFTIDKDVLAELNERLRNEDALVGVSLPINPRSYSPFSCCSIVDGKLSDLLLVTTKEDGNKVDIDFPWIYSSKDSIRGLAAVYNTVIKALKSTYSADSRISFSTINPEMDSILAELIPTAESKEVYMAILDL